MKQINYIFFTSLVIFLAASCHSSRKVIPQAAPDNENINQLSRNEQKDGFEILFDGVSMDKWIDNTNQYIVEDGNIVMNPKTRYGGNLYSKKEYENFIFRFEFLLTPGANNGIGVRHNIVDTPKGYDGVEIQILDDYDPKYKDLEPYQFHGSLYGWVPAKTGFLKPAGEWNYQEIIMDKNHLQIFLNGVQILDVNFDELIKNAPEDKNISRLLYKKGHIAFLGHGDIIRLRSLRVKEI